MLKGFPCRVSDYSTAKPGKHGSAKATIVGIDIFTGKKYEDGGPTASNIMVPEVSKKEYEVLDVNEDGYASLNNEETGQLKEDLKVEDPVLLTYFKENIEAGKTVYASVIAAVGKERIVEGRVK
jgi:translation initiation factor 5A